MRFTIREEYCTVPPVPIINSPIQAKADVLPIHSLSPFPYLTTHLGSQIEPVPSLLTSQTIRQRQRQNQPASHSITRRSQPQVRSHYIYYITAHLHLHLIYTSVALFLITQSYPSQPSAA